VKEFTAMNVILRRDGYPMVPSPTPSARRAIHWCAAGKNCKSSGSKRSGGKRASPSSTPHGPTWAAIDQRIFDHVLLYLMGKDGPLLHAIAEAMAVHREQRREEAKRLVEEERCAFEAKLAALEERLKAAPGKLPVAKTWQPESVTYQAEFVSHGGALFQAKRDTAQAPGGEDRVCVARAGVDGVDGHSPRLRGGFDAHERYRRFDIVTCYDNCYIACRDDPGLPGHDGDAWQLIAKGTRGPSGDVGPRGRKGERGAPGEDAPTIVNWTLDPVHYRAVPTMSNGTQGAVLFDRDRGLA